jgi:hypothetical protein
MDWVAPSLSSGLGNRLFQHAATLGIAERYNKKPCFLINRCTESPHGPLASIFRMFPSIPLIDTSDPYTEIKEPPRAYYEYIDVGDTPAKGNVVLHGFRQSPQYFPHNLGGLEPNWDSALGGPLVRSWIEKDAGLASKGEQMNTVSIHVRLGDYLKLAHHQVDLGGYYGEALNRVKPGSRLHLFSDEPERCAMHFAGFANANGIRFTVARIRSDVESLYEMSLCRGGNITANSTFSWWGAWFAHTHGSPWATYPNKWGQGMPEPTDLFPEWATVLSVSQ